MNNLFFWNYWTKSFKILFFAFISLFGCTLGLFLYSQFIGKYEVLGWNILSESIGTRSIIDTFQKGFFQFAIEVPNFYITQSYEGRPYSLSPLLCYLVTGSICLIWTISSVAISYVKSIWYYVALLLFGAFIFFLRLELLHVFGWNNMYWPIFVFLLFGICIHLFHDFFPGIQPEWRLLFFACMTLVLLAISFSFAGIDSPMLHFVATGWMAPFGLALVYIFLIADEIYQVFLFVATDSKHAKPTSSLLNFLVMSFLFLGNIVLTFLKNRHSIDWNILYLEAPLLLCICAVLSIWGNKKKEPLYEFIADFSPITAIWHLTLAFNCLVCFSFVNLTGNDPLQEVMEDSVIFSQITIGAMFILFVLINFWGYMAQNLPIHMVVYQPKYMPFGFVRIISVIGIMAIVFYNNFYQYRQTLAGYFTGIAEVYQKQGDDLLSSEYLLSAIEQDPGAHKANYALAMQLHDMKKDPILVKGYLKQATFKNPCPQTYASLGYYLLADGDIIRSIEILREGKNRFPKSPEILNNLAIAFSQTNIVDSTLFYLKQAKRFPVPQPVAATNELAFALRHNILPSENEEILDDIAYKANWLALQNKKRQPSPIPFDPSIWRDSVLTKEQLAFVLNLSSNALRDTARFHPSWLDSLSHRSGNTIHYDALMLAKGYSQYYAGKVADGIVTLDQLQATGSEKVFCNTLLSNWLIQQDAPRIAVDFLEKARNAGDRQAAFGFAIASSFYLPAKSALSYWQDPVLLSDSSFRTIAQQLQSTQANVFRVGILPQSFSDTKELMASFRGFPAGNDKNKALGRLMRHLNDHGASLMAIQLYLENNKTQESEWEYARALRKTQQKKEAASFALKTLLPPALYIQAWSMESSNPSDAAKKYRNALTKAPFYEEGILDAVAFLEHTSPPQEIYDWLLQSVMLNQYSAKLQKAYARQCVKMNLFGFADYSIGKLKDLLPAQEYTQFVNEMTQLKENVTQNMKWN